MPDTHAYEEAADAYAWWQQRVEDTQVVLARTRFAMGQNPNDPGIVKAYEEALAAHAEATESLETARQMLAVARAEHESTGAAYETAATLPLGSIPSGVPGTSPPERAHADSGAPEDHGGNVTP